MIDIEVETLSVEEIDALQDKLRTAKATATLRRLIPLHREYQALSLRVIDAIKQYGITLSDFGAMAEPDLETYLTGLRRLMADGKNVQQSKPATKSVPIKYRHPTQPGLAWTGRGSQPVWVREFLGAGGTLDQITI